LLAPTKAVPVMVTDCPTGPEVGVKLVTPECRDSRKGPTVSDHPVASARPSGPLYAHRGSHSVLLGLRARTGRERSSAPLVSSQCSTQPSLERDSVPPSGE